MECVPDRSETSMDKQLTSADVKLTRVNEVVQARPGLELSGPQSELADVKLTRVNEVVQARPGRKP